VSKIEISLPNDTYAEFERLVDEEFLTRERAIEELLSMGLSAYGPAGSSDADSSAPLDSGFGEGAENNLWDTSGREEF
jgi:hypothetical protein